MRRVEGSVVPLVLLAVMVVVLVAALVMELGRALLDRQRLQAAVDAAALSGALQAEPWAIIRVRKSRYACRWVEIPDPDDPAGPPRRERECRWEYDSVLLTGREVDLTREWEVRAGCRGSWSCRRPEILQRWVEFPGETRQAVRAVFRANLPDGVVTLIETDDDAATVTVGGRLRVPVRLLRWVGIEGLTVRRRGVARAELTDPSW